jgi:3-dehydroquinate synthase
VTDRVGPRPAVRGLRLESVLEAVSHDKKARAGRVPFILPTAIGRVAIRDDVSVEDVRAALQAMSAGRAGWG